MLAPGDILEAGSAGSIFSQEKFVHPQEVLRVAGAGGARGRVGSIMPGGIIYGPAAAVWMLASPYPAW